MSDFITVDDMFRLLTILQPILPGLPENLSNIHVEALYRNNRAQIGSEEETFNLFERHEHSFQNAKGFWCWTPLYYDNNGTSIRKVPGARGSWKVKGRPQENVSEDGEIWCLRTFKYHFYHFRRGDRTLNFLMKQYSLGGRCAKPTFALCQITSRRPAAPRANEAIGPATEAQENTASNYARTGGNQTYGGVAMVQLSDPGFPEKDGQPDPPQSYRSRRERLIIYDGDGDRWAVDDESLIRAIKRHTSTHDGSREPNTGNISDQPSFALPSTYTGVGQSSRQVLESTHGAYPNLDGQDMPQLPDFDAHSNIGLVTTDGMAEDDRIRTSYPPHAVDSPPLDDGAFMGLDGSPPFNDLFGP